MNKKKRNEIIYGAGALALAVILLAVSGFGGLRALAVKHVSDGSELSAGDYVEADLSYVLDVIGVERRGNGDATAYFAVAPIGNRFTVIRFPASDFDNMTALEEATAAFLRGNSSSMDFHLIVTGTVRNLDEGTAQLMADWFNDNAAWMSQAGVITAVENYGDYLNGVMVESGRAGRLSYGAAMGVTVAALLLLAVAAAEFVLAGTGRRGEKRKRHG